MSAIYQDARPNSFTELIGQDHVKTVLVKAVERNLVGHAYLFSGPRGVGKTTTARLVAMSVNCEAATGARPCGTCESCALVRRGSHPDVVELDAASNNSVDDVRDLRDKVILTPVRGGRRVWVLDEAHMLSKAAANALLKTLEEPPEGLVFILATTEPERLPPTVLSRCQHFRFRRLSEPEIVSKLRLLCEEAGVEAHEDALGLIARSADGAMRDAETMLERLLLGGATITLASAEDALGLPPKSRLEAMAAHLAHKRLKPLLDDAMALYMDGFAPRTLVEQLKGVLKDALRAHLRGDEDGLEAQGLDEDGLLTLIHILDEEDDRFVRRGDLFSLEVALIKAVAATRAGLASGPIAAEAALSAERGGNTTAEPTGRAEQAALKAAQKVAGRAESATPEPTPKAAQAANTQAQPIKRADRAEAAPAEPVADAEDGVDTKSAQAADQKRGGDPKEQRTLHAARAEVTPSAASIGQDDTASDAAAPKSPQSQKDRRSGEIPASREQGAPSGKWRDVLTVASPQLKAFLMPARAKVEGREIRVEFQATHKFHFEQLSRRDDELSELVKRVFGDDATVRIRCEGAGKRSVGPRDERSGGARPQALPETPPVQVAHEADADTHSETRPGPRQHSPGERTPSSDKHSDADGFERTRQAPSGAVEHGSRSSGLESRRVPADAHSLTKPELGERPAVERSPSEYHGRDEAPDAVDAGASGPGGEACPEVPLAERTEARAVASFESGFDTERDLDGGQDGELGDDQGDTQSIEDHPLFPELAALFPGRIVRVERRAVKPERSSAQEHDDIEGIERETRLERDT